MEAANMEIDLLKLIKFILRHVWLPILCAIIGFAGMFTYATITAVDTYTASATLYVYNGNPNVVNYSYTNASDLSSAVKLLDTYMVVIKSNKVMDVVIERLSTKYPEISAKDVTETLSMGSVSDTGVLSIRSTTTDPQLSADICNNVVDVAPQEIIRVVSAGSIEVIDYADVPKVANARGTMKKALTGGLAGGVLACGLLFLIFMLNGKVRDEKELTDSYDLPVLAEIPRDKKESKKPWTYLINDASPLSVLEAYNKLRMNLDFSLVGKRRIVIVSSAVPGEGKSTITANLAICCAKTGRKTLLIDGDMRRSSQSNIFLKSQNRKAALGLSNVIIHECEVKDAVIHDIRPNLDLLAVGSVPPNPAELLNSSAMSSLLTVLESEYKMIIIDMPPINVVSDPLILAKEDVGMLYVTRQDYSEHREIRKALTAADLSKIDIFGFALYGENISGYGRNQTRYYKKYYKNYYKNYYSRSQAASRKEDSDKWELSGESNVSKKAEQKADDMDR